MKSLGTLTSILVLIEIVLVILKAAKVIHSNWVVWSPVLLVVALALFCAAWAFIDARNR